MPSPSPANSVEARKMQAVITRAAKTTRNTEKNARVQLGKYTRTAEREIKESRAINAKITWHNAEITRHVSRDRGVLLTRLFRIVVNVYTADFT